jgi:peptide chain release factor 3
MLLDNRKGVEERTRQLFAVCKRRRMPIFTVVNKCDRVGEDPLKLIGDVEADLGIDCHPITWPIHADGAFVGVYDRRRKLIYRFERGEDHGASAADVRVGASSTTSRCSTRRGIRSAVKRCSRVRSRRCSSRAR